MDAKALGHNLIKLRQSFSSLFKIIWLFLVRFLYKICLFNNHYTYFFFGLIFETLAPPTADTPKHSTSDLWPTEITRWQTSGKHQHDDECSSQRDASWCDDTFTSTVSTINQLRKASIGNAASQPRGPQLKFTTIKKVKKQKKAKKGKKRKFTLRAKRRARANEPPLLPIPSLPFYFRLKESLSQK